MAKIVLCKNNHSVGINTNSADFNVLNGNLQIQCALCKNNGNNVWVDFGPAPTDNVLNISTLGEGIFFTKEMCYDILKKESYIKKTGVTTDKTYMTLSALKTFVTNVFTGDAGVTITCSQSTNDNYYPLESEISIVGKQYQTFTPPAPIYREIHILKIEIGVGIYDEIIGEYHFYTELKRNAHSTTHSIYVVGNGTPPTTNQISVTVKYKHTTNGAVTKTTVSNSNMNYKVAPDGAKYVFKNAKYDWFGRVGITSTGIFFVGLE